MDTQTIAAQTVELLTPPPAPSFSPVLIPRSSLWRTNSWLEDAPQLPILHLGCGDNVIEEFVNVDFVAKDSRVLEWDLLDYWPRSMDHNIGAVHCENVMEHFFYAEQMYILCSANRALQANGVFRVLTPNLDGLVKMVFTFTPERHPFFAKGYGIETGADALNASMRIGGHKWLHNQDSLTRLARACGFAPNPTRCAESCVEALRNINLRNESSSVSFANDLIKLRNISRIVVEPSMFVDCDEVGNVGGIALRQATSRDPQVYYQLPQALSPDAIAMVNIRCTNLDAEREHNFAQIFFENSEAGSYTLDETTKSRGCMNAVPGSAILTRVTPGTQMQSIRFDPTWKSGDRMLVGPLEIFYFE